MQFKTFSILAFSLAIFCFREGCMPSLSQAAVHEDSSSKKMKFTGLGFDEQRIESYKGLSIEEIIARIKSEEPSLKIIFFEDKDKSGVLNPGIPESIVSRYGDVDLAPYYQNYKDKCDGIEGVKGQYVAANSFISVIPGDVRSENERPGFESDLILLSRNASRHVLLHEFMHFLIDKHRNQPPVTLPDVGKVHYLTAQHLSVGAIAEAITKTYPGKDPSSEEIDFFMVESRNFFNDTLNGFIEGIKLDINSYGEEIDIEYFLINNLHTTQDETSDALGYIRSNLHKIYKRYDVVAESPFFKACVRFDAEISIEERKKCAALDRILNHIKQSVDETEHWIESRMAK